MNENEGPPKINFQSKNSLLLDSDESDVPWSDSKISDIEEDTVRIISRKWSENIQSHIIEPFLGERGSTHKLPQNSSGKSYIFLFLGEDLYEHLVEETILLRSTKN